MIRPNLKRSVTFLAVFLVSLSLGRVLLLGFYYADFARLSWSAVVASFIHGVRFDLSITLLFVGLPLFLLAIPANWARNRLWQGFLSWTCFAALFAFVVLVGSDLVYFSFVGRHIGSELAVALAQDWEAVLWMALDYPVGLIALASTLVALGAIWARLISEDISEATYSFQDWGVWLLALPLIVIGGRGGLQGKPLNIVNAFQSGSVEEGYLVLNGPFSAFHSGRVTTGAADLSYFPFEEALKSVRVRLERPSESWLSSDFPLERSGGGRAATAAQGTNVVVIVLESWDALVTDAIRTRVGLEPLGLTPSFDALAQEGLLLSRFYASGQRSIEGMAALLASVHTLPGMPYLGRGMEQSRLGYLGNYGRANGYGTVFVRSAKRSSFRLDAVSALAGFDVYGGAEDILPTGSHTEAPTNVWGAWDYDSLRFFHERLLEVDGPFLGFFFGSTTHTPFRLPGSQWEKRDSGSREDRFLNTVNYVDWALGEFIKMAKEAGYYDETLFVILADQTSGFQDSESIVDRHWIPALLVGPGIPHGSADDRIASQMDLTPTLIDYLGWVMPHASLGQSLLGDRVPMAILKNGENMIRVGPDGWVMHDLQNRIDASGSEEVVSDLERELLAEIQVVGRLLAWNRLFSGN